MPSTPSSPGLASCPQLPPNPDGSPAVWSQACGGSAARFSCFSGFVFSAAVRMWQLQRLSVTVSILRVGVSLAKPCAQSPRLKSGVCRCVPERMGPFQARPRSLQNSVPGQTFCFPAGSARVAVGTRAPSGARHEVRPRQQPNSRGRTSLCGVTRSLGQFPPTLTHRPLTEGAEPHGGTRAVYYLGHCARILEN